MARYIGYAYFQFLRWFNSAPIKVATILGTVIILGWVVIDATILTSEPDLANETLSDSDSKIDPQALATSLVDGYASSSSVVQGGSIDFHISATVPNYQINVYRYAANGLVLMTKITNLPPGVSYNCGPIGVVAGQETVDLGCDWPVAYTLNVPTNWPSGLYVANLWDEDGWPGGYSSNIFFIVKEDEPGSEADILVQLPTNTWQAYNAYGGWSLYSAPPGRRITFDRPFQPCYTGGGCPYRWESPLVRWLEAEGYTVDYVASEDIQTDPTLLFNYKLFITAGHDEYWSKEIRDHIDAFISAGGNVAIFSGNTSYRQVRYEENTRTLVCYKWEDRQNDPLYGVDNIRVASEFAWDPIFWPENTTTGLGFRAGGWVNLTDDSKGRYTVYRSEHWVYQGTGLQDGDIFWYEPNETVEVDGAEFTWQNGLPVVTGQDQTPLNFSILGLQPATKLDGGLRGYATMGLYKRSGGGMVFNAATMGWVRGLSSEYNPGDYEIVRQITRNVIDTLSTGNEVPPPTYPVEQTHFTYQPANPGVGEPVTFSAVVTPAHATSPISYTWQFGDGGTAVTTLNPVIHIYNLVGTYTVSLTASNAYGQSDYSQTIVLTVQSLPSVDEKRLFLPLVLKNFN